MTMWDNMLKEVILSTCMYMLSGGSTSTVYLTIVDDLKPINGIEMLINTMSDCYNNYLCPICHIRCYKAVNNKVGFSKIYCKRHKWIKFKFKPECWAEKDQ